MLNYKSYDYIEAGWWLGHPSEKCDFVNWDDEIPNIWENQTWQPNHQLGGSKWADHSINGVKKLTSGI